MRLFSVIILGLLVSACSTLDKFVDSNDETGTEKNTGNRIAILIDDPAIEVNHDLARRKMFLPDMDFNDSWNLSDSISGKQKHVYLSEDFGSGYESESIGVGYGDSHYSSYTPVVAKGKIFALNADAELVAVDAKDTSSQIWQADLNKDDVERYGGGILHSDDKLFVSIGSNNVFAYDAERGQEVWRVKLGGIVRSAPIGDDKRIYVLTTDNRTYALSKKSGRVKWVHRGIAENIGYLGAASPALWQNTLFVPYSSGELYALNKKTGQQLWYDSVVYNHPTSFTVADIDATPVIYNNIVYSVSNSGLLAAHHAGTGNKIWDRKIGSNKVPWVAGDYMYVVSNKGQLVCISSYKGQVRWVADLPEYDDYVSWGYPVLAGEKVIVSNNQGHLLMVDPNNGNIDNVLAIPDNIFGGVAIADNAAFFLSNDDDLISIK